VATVKVRMPILLMSDAPVSDPARDYLRFERYCNPLVDILTEPAVQTPLTIGVFGVWGSGKSTVIRLTDHVLERDHPDAFVRVHFNAWMHRKEPNMLVPLLHALHDTLASDPAKRFEESAKKIWNVFVRLGANLVLKAVTADKVDVKELEALETRYAEEKGRVESTIRKLSKILQDEADALEAQGVRLVFFIDDLDRCEPDQMIDLLDSIKLFLDLRNAFFIIAADKEVIDRGVETRYGKYKFAEGRTAEVGAEYLDKLVQVPFYLLPLYSDDVASYVKDISAQLPADLRELLSQVALPNPRKVKRIINAYWILDAIAHKNLDRGVLLRLQVLQIQNSGIYWPSARENKLLLALEEAYNGKVDVTKIATFAKYAPIDNIVMNFCNSHYDPSSSLRHLFHNSPFAAVGPRLSDHFAAVGQ
jgi:ferritin